MSPSKRTGRVSLLDLIALIAATAVGSALTRSFAGLESITRIEIIDLVPGSLDGGARSAINAVYWPPATVRATWAQYLAYWLQRVSLWSGPCLACWTMGVLALGIQAHGRPWRSVWRQPGIMAGVAWLVGACASAVVSPQTLLRWTGPAGLPSLHWRDWWLLTSFALPRIAGFAVAISWLSLALSGRWTTARGWHDRAGRVLGACWIALALASVLASWLATF